MAEITPTTDPILLQDSRPERGESSGGERRSIPGSSRLDSSRQGAGDSARSWAIVLAAGDGTRLRDLTPRGGVATPRQYCSLRGERSLLGDALARAARVVPRKRILVVVAAEHRRFWEPELAALPPDNILVQPANRGTAPGILLPALAVLERDPGARLAYLPSDHFVEKGYVVESSLRIALESLDDASGGLRLLGMRSDAPDPGYGWIVPARNARLLPPVERFVEKPRESTAAALMAAGALWNSFLFAVQGAALLRFYEQCLPELVRRFREVYALDAGARPAGLAALYAELGTHDFSRDVLQREERRLRLEYVPPCGTDLGTPARVAACLAVLRDQHAAPPPERSSGGRVVLALALWGS